MAVLRPDILPDQQDTLLEQPTSLATGFNFNHSHKQIIVTVFLVLSAMEITR